MKVPEEWCRSLHRGRGEGVILLDSEGVTPETGTGPYAPGTRRRGSESRSWWDGERRVFLEVPIFRKRFLEPRVTQWIPLDPVASERLGHPENPTGCGSWSHTSLPLTPEERTSGKSDPPSRTNFHGCRHLCPGVRDERGLTAPPPWSGPTGSPGIPRGSDRRNVERGRVRYPGPVPRPLTYDDRHRLDGVGERRKGNNGWVLGEEEGRMGISGGHYSRTRTDTHTWKPLRLSFVGEDPFHSVPDVLKSPRLRVSLGYPIPSRDRILYH